MNEPLVAIVIPVYNTEKYIEECIQHIMAQTYSNWVCYITDNASTDNTLPIIEQYVRHDNRFKIFQNSETLKAVENWNMAYSHIVNLDAKYVKLEPADDWMFPEYLEKMVEILERDENIGACFSFRLDDKKVNCYGLDIYEGNIFDGKEVLYAELTGKYRISGSLGTPLYRISSLKSIFPDLQVFNENNFHPDTELAHDVMQKYKIGFAYQVLSYIRRHNETETTIAKKYNTYLNGFERTIYKRLYIFPGLHKNYKNYRLYYAWFLLKKNIMNDKECVQWHKKHIERRFRVKEYMICPFYVFFMRLKQLIYLYTLHEIKTIY